MTEAAPNIPYAVLFKTHFWDDFVESQFRHLQARAGTDAVFILVDETHGPVAGIPHDKVLRITEQISEEMGFYQYPKGNSFWYNNDYPTYHFLAEYPEFKYVVIAEFDVAVNVEIRPIIHAMAAQGLEFVCEHIAEDMKWWMWTKSVAPFYPAGLAFTGRLCCFEIFSQECTYLLQMARQDHTRRMKAGEIAYPADFQYTWPFSEAFVGAEIARLAVPNTTFAAFADMSHYDFWPPYHPDHAAKLAHGTIIHPVLTDERMVTSILRFPFRIAPETWLDPHSTLRTRLAYAPPAKVVPALLEKFKERKNLNAIISLWHELPNIGWQDHTFPLIDVLQSLLPPAEIANIALGKFAYQSSVCPWSRSQIPYQDAAFAVNGHIPAEYAFHTGEEINPWWMVDLGGFALISEIVIFNRPPPYAHRANNLCVSASPNGRDWTLLHKRSPTAGAQVEPLKISFPSPLLARFIRVELFAPGILHLAQVQVFGIELYPTQKPAAPDAPQPAAAAPTQVAAA